MKILSVVGARPNFMKVAPIIRAIREHNRKASGGQIPGPSGSTPATVEHILVHTGQHYDEAMSEAFFRDLDMPKPDVLLSVGSASHAAQTAEIMRRFEGVVLKEEPDAVIVVGDVNSTLACALVASKINYSSRNGAGPRRPLIVHVEAGLRSFDREMPEEINRVLTDHISDLLFVTEESAVENLRGESVPGDRIFFTGNTMIDTLMAFSKRAGESKILAELGLVTEGEAGGAKNGVTPYMLLTLHRPSNVDSKEPFENIMSALKEISGQMAVIFPAHPRTKKRIEEYGLGGYFECDGRGGGNEKVSTGGIYLTNPLGYIDFLCLMENARMVLTDSGGIQEETTCLGVPCVTLRENTERPITLTQGTNVLAGGDRDEILNTIRRHLERSFERKIPEKWDGRAAERIVDVLVKKTEIRSSRRH